MKNTLLLILMSICSLSAFCQQVTDNARYDRFMKKSKQRQLGGIIFLTSGAAATAGGLFLISDGSKRIKEANNDGDYYGDRNRNANAEQFMGIMLTGMGVSAMFTSIPFFAGAHKAKKKAMSISLKKEGVSRLYKSGFSTQFYPALALQIRIGH